MLAHLLAIYLTLGACVGAAGTGSVDMGTCSMTCEGAAGAQFTGLVPKSIAAGPPGKRGPRGERGSDGNRGEKGQKGDAAVPCVCPEQQHLIDQIDELKEELRRSHTPYDCSEVVVTRSRGGIFTIYPTEDLALEVYCDTSTDGGGWTVFQRRMDGSEDFFRGWDDYVKGFGDLKGEFWLGLDAIYKLMQTGKYELRADMEDFNNETGYARYTGFSVGSPEELYIATTAGYTGDAGNAMLLTKVPFSTKDQDNDLHKGHCANSYKGGWWYGACHASNPNGLYLNGNHTSYADGVNWKYFRGYHHSLKFMELKMRKIA